MPPPRELKRIYSPIQSSLSLVERELKSRLKDTGYETPYGKLLRPALNLFSSYTFKKNDNPKSVSLAVALELIHNASLIHDDILDNAMARRDISALHIPLGLRKALLFGDILFTQALKMAQSLDKPVILSSLIETVKTMCEGQWIEINLDGSKKFSSEIYLDIINKKTASLFACSCETGALLRDAPDDEVELFKKFGFQFGILYQILDDLDDLKDNPQDIIILRLNELGGEEYCQSLAKEYFKKAKDAMGKLPNPVVQEGYNHLVDYLASVSSIKINS